MNKIEQRTGKECKKTECIRYDNYLKWSLGDRAINFCMQCKHSHKSQYKSKSNKNVS